MTTESYDMRIPAMRGRPTLESLMDDDLATNQWVHFETLEFYVRKSHICTGHGKASLIKPCLMVANVNSRRRGAFRQRATIWTMIAFMRKVEAIAVKSGYDGVFVECVYNPTLQQLLTSFKYRQIRPDRRAPCYFMPTASIIARNALPLRRIDSLQRPSLRRFLHTPDIARFWLHEQAENLVMLVRRDQIDAASPDSRLRMTILQMYRYRTDAPQGLAGHMLYWANDAGFVAAVLGKLEARLAGSGFAELALSTRAVSPFIRDATGFQTNAGADMRAGERHLRQFGYRTAADGAAAGQHVKSLGHVA